MGQELSNLGFDPANPDGAMDMILAEARGLPKTGDTKYGTSPQYYRDAAGQVKVGQLSSSGGFRPADIPGEVLPGVQFQDLGTEVVGLDRRTGQRVTSQPVDVAGKEAQKVVGKAQGEAQVNYPKLAAQSSQALATIENLLNDPYLPSMTGMVAGRQPNISEDSARVQGKIDQLQSQVFLEGYERLKGGGVITDFEGQKAELAIARISDPRVSYPDYVQAVSELRDVIKAGTQRAAEAAGVQPPQQGGQGANVDSIKQKYGLE
jgi:hypothetical protein